MDHTRNALIVVDTETTGLPSNPDARPIQVGAVAFDMTTGKEISEFCVLMRPDVWANGFEKAEAVHGLSVAHVQDNGVGMAAGWAKWADWMETFKLGPYKGGQHRLTAWNTGFDRWMLMRWFEQAHNRPNMSWEMPEWPNFRMGPVVTEKACLQAGFRLWCANRGYPVPRFGALAQAAKALGLPEQPKPHNAVSDARLAGLVWWAIEQEYRDMHGEGH